MSNLGTWTILRLPVFVAVMGCLKGQKQNIALWVYLWTLCGLWGITFWHGYSLALEMQRVSFMPSVPETPVHYLLANWLDIAEMALLMALPPILYFYNRRKLRILSVG